MGDPSPPTTDHLPPTVEVEVLAWIARGLGGPRADKAVWQEPISADETLGDLMDRLTARYPQFTEFYDPNMRTLQEHVELVLNGRLFDLVGGFAAPLRSGDSVMIFPGFSGG